ncbi:MAG: MIP family channel protein [Bdellovibrionales bacterium]|nr:MIP family channel protein [Bdellovibrionales bacterium]
MKITHPIPQYIAEFIGSFFLVFFGCGSIILVDVGSGVTPSAIPLVFGGAVSIMIYSLGHISGAHFNPAVTLGFWSMGRFPTLRIPGYLAAQMGGASLASLLHLFIWGYDHSFGATHLSVNLPIGVLLEFLLSFVLMFVIASVATDSRAVGELAGIAIGSTVSLCALVGGPLTGASMNPARSFGPALFAGFDSSIWVYLLAPIIGTIFGAKTYDWIRCHREASESPHGCC